jgi:hypothetical protein
MFRNLFSILYTRYTLLLQLRSFEEMKRKNCSFSIFVQSVLHRSPILEMGDNSIVSYLVNEGTTWQGGRRPAARGIYLHGLYGFCQWTPQLVRVCVSPDSAAFTIAPGILG